VRTHPVAAPRLAPLADDHALLLPALRNVGQRDVRDADQDLLERILGRRELALETADLLAQRTPAADQLLGRLAGPLQPSDLLRGRVARGLALLDRLNERAPLPVEGDAALDEWPY